jgi:HSP20 family molecular chaperone IbpA
MSIVPLLVNLAREMETDHMSDIDHFLDDDFGFGIHPVDIFHRPRSLILHPRRRCTPYERAHQLLSKRTGGRRHDRGDGDRASSLMPVVGKDGFQACMDVAQFKPNELTVKTVDNTVVVEGKHEEREDDHGFIQRHFIRKYTLPKGYDVKDVVSTISSDGVLTVKAPPPSKNGIERKERIVQIQHTGPAHLSVKAPEQGSGKNVENGSAEKMETNK